MYVVTVCGRAGTQKQAVRALQDAGLALLDTPAYREPGSASAFLSCEADHPDQVGVAVAPLGWAVRAHSLKVAGAATPETELRKMIREEIERAMKAGN